MKIWATSDLHLDYQENWDWFLNLSAWDYTDDILIIAGDIVHDIQKIKEFFKIIVPKFKKVLFVPGNHDVWLKEGDKGINSLQKFHQLLDLARDEGVQTTSYQIDKISIVPLFAWYDFSFGEPSESIKRAWVDFKACKWPMDLAEISSYFGELNKDNLKQENQNIISFSHFVPRMDLIPPNVPNIVKALLPVFGSTQLGKEVKKLGSDMHIYGHSHLNRSLEKDGTWYLNNAFGYPQEKHICRKILMPVYENGQIIKGIKQWPIKD